MHIGLIAPESHSHAAVATNVGRALAARGHRVSYVGFEDVRAVPEAAGLEFLAIAPDEYPDGSVDRMMREISEARGLRSSLRTMKALGELLDCRLRRLPALLRDAGIEALVADQISPAAATVCELLHIPHATICAAVHMNYDEGVPPFFTPWQPRADRLGTLRNLAGYSFFDLVRRPMRRRLNRFRADHHLAPYRDPHAGMSRRVQISQLHPAIDFAYTRLPDTFHYAGPLGDMTADQPGAFDETKLDGRPLVYCSFGTVNNKYRHLYATVLRAMANVDAQLLLSTGGGDLDLGNAAPPDAIIATRVPQRRVLQHCAAFISHCGVNSALEAVYAGVPIVGIPIANDQPGMAARLAYHGAGVALSSRNLRWRDLTSAVRTALVDPQLRATSVRLQAEIRNSPGAAGAARLIEAAIARTSVVNIPD